MNRIILKEKNCSITIFLLTFVMYFWANHSLTYLLAYCTVFLHLPELEGWKDCLSLDGFFDARDFDLTPDLDVGEYALDPR